MFGIVITIKMRMNVERDDSLSDSGYYDVRFMLCGSSRVMISKLLQNNNMELV